MAGRIPGGGVASSAWPWFVADVVRDSGVFIKASKSVLGLGVVNKIFSYRVILLLVVWTLLLTAE